MIEDLYLFLEGVNFKWELIGEPKIETEFIGIQNIPVG